MKTASLEKSIEKGVRLLTELLPLKKYLYFPLLYAILVWAVRRTEGWKKEILSLEVFLEPDIVETKPDEYILGFFKEHPELEKTYRNEIKNKDIRSLRKAFCSLYPVMGLEDPFLQGLFFDELQSGDHRKIVEGFKARVSAAKKDIELMEKRSKLETGLRRLGEEIASLAAGFVDDTNSRKVIASLIKKYLLALPATK